MTEELVMFAIEIQKFGSKVIVWTPLTVIRTGGSIKLHWSYDLATLPGMSQHMMFYKRNCHEVNDSNDKEGYQ